MTNIQLYVESITKKETLESNKKEMAIQPFLFLQYNTSKIKFLENKQITWIEFNLTKNKCNYNNKVQYYWKNKYYIKSIVKHDYL